MPRKKPEPVELSAFRTDGSEERCQPHVNCKSHDNPHVGAAIDKHKSSFLIVTISAAYLLGKGANRSRHTNKKPRRGVLQGFYRNWCASAFAGWGRMRCNQTHNTLTGSRRWIRKGIDAASSHRDQEGRGQLNPRMVGSGAATGPFGGVPNADLNHLSQIRFVLLFNGVRIQESSFM